MVPGADENEGQLIIDLSERVTELEDQVVTLNIDMINIQARVFALENLNIDNRLNILESDMDQYSYIDMDATFLNTPNSSPFIFCQNAPFKVIIMEKVILTMVSNDEGYVPASSTPSIKIGYTTQINNGSHAAEYFLTSDFWTGGSTNKGGIFIGEFDDHVYDGKREFVEGSESIGSYGAWSLVFSGLPGGENYYVRLEYWYKLYDMFG